MCEQCVGHKQIDYTAGNFCYVGLSFYCYDLGGGVVDNQDRLRHLGLQLVLISVDVYGLC